MFLYIIFSRKNFLEGSLNNQGNLTILLHFVLLSPMHNSRHSHTYNATHAQAWKRTNRGNKSISHMSFDLTLPFDCLKTLVEPVLIVVSVSFEC